MPRRAVPSLILTVAAVWLAAPAAAQAPEPYVDPPFADECVVHEFGEGDAPAFGSLGDDPLCVRYAKEDITVDNGGALAFLAGEPERVMAAVPVCAYWQQDRWSVQVSEGALALVSWEGSYWFDRGTGQAAAILRDFRIAGQSASADEVAAILEAASPEWAQVLRDHAGSDGGGGAVSFGGGDPTCAAAAEPDPTGPEPDPTPDDGASGDPGGTDAAPAPSLPATGGGALAGAGVLAGLAAVGLRRLVRCDGGNGAT